MGKEEVGRGGAMRKGWEESKREQSNKRDDLEKCKWWGEVRGGKTISVSHDH